MSAVEPDMEDLFQEKKRVRNPLVPLGLSSIFVLSFALSSHSFALSFVLNFTQIVLSLSASIVSVISRFSSLDCYY